MIDRSRQSTTLTAQPILAALKMKQGFSSQKIGSRRDFLTKAQRNQCSASPHAPKLTDGFGMSRWLYQSLVQHLN